MKKFRLFIIAILVITTFLTACSNKKGSKDDPDAPKAPVTVYTDTAIVKNGVSDYKVVIASDASSYEMFAGAELVSLIYKSTGVKLQTITDTGLTYNETDKYLSVGNNAYYKSANLGYDLNALGFSDYYMHTKGNSLFMVGGNKYGTLYAAYDILERLIDLEVYADDEIYVKTATELFLPDIKTLVEPQFDYRLGSREITWVDNTYERRLKLQSMNQVIMNTGGQNHNSFGTI